MPRRYNSARRTASAAVTRTQIVTAARQLFASQGYGASSIQAVARAAGVAVPTVYATFGSKRAILLAILDSADVETGTRQLFGNLKASAGDHRAQLAHVIEFTVRFNTVNADLIRLTRTAAGAEPDLADLWTEGEARRRAAQAPLVHAWKPMLVRGLAAGTAADILWSLTGPEMYQAFVTQCGWTTVRFSQWLRSTLEGLLFREPRARRSTR
jgi:AcrR family transcriptional regulator